MPTFPSAINHSTVDAFTEEVIDTTISDDGDMGPLARRQTQTGKKRRFSYAHVITSSQKTTLDTFHDTTVSQVMPFDWSHPIEGAIEVIFESRPVYSAISNNLYRVEFTLREI